MKNLTKQEILNLVKEANEQELQEYFPSDADREIRNRKENLLRYQSLLEGARNFYIQIMEKAQSDYENGIIDDSDVDYLINDQCERAMAAVDYLKSSLIALKTQGIKPTERSPIYPTSRYEE
tara:strand:- start:197 stop:562 length:366 start_codon:yes stop_codon:yes gene_type:complete